MSDYAYVNYLIGFYRFVEVLSASLNWMSSLLVSSVNYTSGDVIKQKYEAKS